ncbi:MAG TPA: O-antigen ligase family protein [Cyclobacteriaceae bacterium]|nr:O-antigen ligase family protein [Cyclobacteriaceae bacterium]
MDLSRLFWFTFRFFVFTIPLSQFLSSRLLALLFVLSLFIRSNKFSDFFKNSWDFIVYLAVLAIGLLYSADIYLGIKVIETNLSFIAIPFIFSSLKYIDEKRSNEIFYSFALGLILSCCICLIVATSNFFSTGDLQSFLYYNLTDTLSLHPTYFAYYLIFANTYGLYLLYYQTDSSNLLIKSFAILFFLLVLLLTGGQTAFVSMLLIFAFFILKFLTEEKSKVKRVTIGLIVTMLLGMFVTTMIAQNGNTVGLTDSWDRLILWQSAINAVPEPIFGVGTGDYKEVLNKYYLDHNLIKFANESFNSHNQFIQLLYSNGLLGALALILMISRPLYLSSKRENILAILILFPFLIYGMTEVFLGRYQGVVFFALTHQLFTVQMSPIISSNVLKSNISST